MGNDVREAFVGEMTLAFDGRVVELFGVSDSHRYHLREVQLELSEPDRKDRRRLLVGRGVGGAMIRIEPEDWPAVEDLLGEIAAEKARAGFAGE